MSTSPYNTSWGWGGKWTDEKLDTFEKYVKAYLTIMNKFRDKYHWIIIYFDGFAGNGSRTIKEQREELLNTNQLFGINTVTSEELNIYKGAAERVLKIETEGTRGFDYYYFIDKDKDACNNLKEKLSCYNTIGKKFFLSDDANQALKKLANIMHINNSIKALVLLDPFGMQINWTSINELAMLSIDLWILVPTGVIINRLLKRDINNEKGLIYSDKLQSFFGIPISDIKDVFYTKINDMTLFGNDEKIIKKESPIKKIAELYIKGLEKIFNFVTKEPFVLYNKYNVPIYHLIFASNNKVAKKIAQDIIDKK